MPDMPLDLAADRPGIAARILELHSKDEAFMEAAGAYIALAEELQEIETGIEPVNPAYSAQLRRRRGELKDRLIEMLNA